MTDDFFVDLGPDITVNKGAEFTLVFDTNFDYDSILWSPSQLLLCQDCAEPKGSLSSNATFTVILVDRLGCSISDEILIFINQKVLFMANVFSPNEDGVNDTFMVHAGASVQSVALFEIYDRWGNKVFLRENFTPNDSQFGWNGSHSDNSASPGVYTYRVEVILEDGSVEYIFGSVAIVL